MLDYELLQIHNYGVILICDHDECPVLAINAQDDTSRTIIPIQLFCASKILLYAIVLKKRGVQDGGSHITNSQNHIGK